jgi:APA family basic amino acid/polyamine antiporter
MLPGIFGKVHIKYKTPKASILLIGGICSLSPLLGKNALIWFVDASAFGTVVAYLCVAISFVMIGEKEKNLNRPFKVKGRRFFGYINVIITTAFVFLYIPVLTDPLAWPYEWLLILGWVGLGVVLAGLAQTAYGHISDADREYMIFGKEYAREEILSQEKNNLH